MRHRSPRRTTLGRGTYYRGVPSEAPYTPPPRIEPEPGEPKCSHCGCKVRLVKYFPGVPKPAENPLAGNHREGGTTSRGGGTCPGSYREPVYTSDTV